MIGGDIGDFEVSDVEQIAKIVEDALVKYRQAGDEITECDKKQQDILHDLELSDHTYHECGHLAKDLIEVRRRRRLAKNTVDLLEPVVKWKSENQAAMNKLSNTIGAMRKIKERQDNMVYFRKTGEDAGTIIEHRES